MNAGMQKFQNDLVQRAQYLKAIPVQTEEINRKLPYNSLHKGQDLYQKDAERPADGEIQVHVCAERNSQM